MDGKTLAKILNGIQFAIGAVAAALAYLL